MLRLNSSSKWLALFLAMVIVLVLIQPVLAQDSKILELTVRNMEHTQKWWDDLWRDTFDPTNPINSISIYSFSKIVRFITGIGVIFWLIDYGKKMVASQGMAQNVQIFAQSFLPIFLIILFLGNQGTYSRALAYGLRDKINYWSEDLMTAQIAGVSLAEAMSEQLLVEEVKNQIKNQADKCMQMPQPEVVLPSLKRPPSDPNNPLTLEQDQAYRYFECLEKLIAYIEQKTQEGLQDKLCGTGCTYFKEFMKAMALAAATGFSAEANIRVEDYQAINNPAVDKSLEEDYQRMADFVKNFEKNGWMYVFNIVQWLWMSFIEFALWLMGLFAPLFIAMSIIPGKQNMFMFWLIQFMTIGLAKVAYIAVVGVVAAQISTSGTVLLTQDARFFMALGAFAPAVSFAVVTAGGIAAAMSFRNQSIGAISTVAGIATGSITTIMYSFARYADKRR